MPYMKKLISHLTFQVIVAIVLGILVGYNFPQFAATGKLLSQTFINMITMLIAPIIFLTIVLGIAHLGNMKKVGRIGIKALIYFELITTLALSIGLIVANLVKPGKGMEGMAFTFNPNKAAIQQFNNQPPFNWGEFVSHIVPHNVFDAFTKGDVLQILFFAILFGFGLAQLKAEGKSILNFFEKLSKVFFQIMKWVMKLAPIAAFGSMAFTIGTYGIHTLLPMGKLMLCVYITMAIFIFGVLNLICYLFHFSLWQYLKFIWQEILIVLGTSSSESVLPSMLQKMEQFGCNKSVVGLVIPTGYSFNLDGTSIYLSIAVIFLSQITNVPLSISQQLMVMGVLMLTSKGAAAVTGGGFIVLSSTLTALHVIPVESIAILLGVDRFMSEGRAITNLIGNGIATVVVAKSEKEFDEKKYKHANLEPALEKDFIIE